MISDVVRAEGLAQLFGARTVFRDVSFTVGQGEVFAILGASGSGKSTLLRQLVGLLAPSAGRVEVLGQPPAAARRAFGVMFQSGALLGSMTVLENVMLPLEVHTSLPPEGREAVARVKLGLVGLEGAADRMPGEISGGMTRRAGIARALALDPPLLFLDEPSAGLDPPTSAEIDRLMLDLRDDLGTTLVLVTHELASILTVPDRCIMLDAGAAGVLAEGAPKHLRADSDNPVVRAFFRRGAAG